MSETLTYECCEKPMRVVGQTDNECSFLVRWCSECGKIQFGYHHSELPKVTKEK